MITKVYRILSIIVTSAAFFTFVFIFVGSSDISASEKSQKSGEKSAKKLICVTFNGLPAVDSFDKKNPELIMKSILDTLNAHKVRSAGFVVGRSIDQVYDIFGEWLNTGHRLGNMTFTHSDFHEMGIEQFIKDIKAGSEALEVMLSGFGQKPRFFRYPFLHYGKDVNSRRQVSLYLEAHNIKVVHSTVVVEDYLYNLSLQKLGSSSDSADVDQLLNEYVNHVLNQIEIAETISKRLLGRKCCQILQLRANRLNALFLGEMLTAIGDAGYTFVTIDRALKDRVYTTPQAYYGSRGIGYLDMIDKSDPNRLPAR